jgi:hypothetical protein
MNALPTATLDTAATPAVTAVLSPALSVLFMASPSSLLFHLSSKLQHQYDV